MDGWDHVPYTRPSYPAPYRPGGRGFALKILNLVLESVVPHGSSTARAGLLDLVIRHLRILNSVTLASTRVFIRVAILGLRVSQKDWIDQGSHYTCRGRGKLW